MSQTILGFGVFDSNFRNICTPSSDKQILDQGLN